MNPQQLWGAVATVVVTVMGTVLYQTHHIDKRFEAIEKRFEDRFAALDKRFDDLKDWIRAELRRIDDRLDRLEHPVVKNP